MQRYQIINHLIKKYNFKNYLEIGTQHGNCFVNIELPREQKYCIDIQKNFADLDEEISSDAFFTKLERKYDLIFIDGDHSYEQSLKDVKNALNALTSGGMIVCHDCYPISLAETSASCKGGVYKTILHLKSKNPELSIYVINSDCGVGVIQKECSELIKLPDPFTFDYFLDNAKTLLNLIEPEEFIKL